jgi:hypothetical protein
MDPMVFERARHAMAGGLALRSETSLGRAERLSLGLEPLDFDPYAALSPTDVQRAVESYLQPPARVVLVTRHGKQYPPQGVVLARSERTR